MQGTAADVIKVAMIRIHDRLRDEGRGARLVLQVHDELLLEAPETRSRARQGARPRRRCAARIRSTRRSPSTSASATTGTTRRTDYKHVCEGSRERARDPGAARRSAPALRRAATRAGRARCARTSTVTRTGDRVVDESASVSSPVSRERGEVEVFVPPETHRRVRTARRQLGAVGRAPPGSARGTLRWPRRLAGRSQARPHRVPGVVADRLAQHRVRRTEVVCADWISLVHSSGTALDAAELGETRAASASTCGQLLRRQVVRQRSTDSRRVTGRGGERSATSSSLAISGAVPAADVDKRSEAGEVERVDERARSKRL